MFLINGRQAPYSHNACYLDDVTDALMLSLLNFIFRKPGHKNYVTEPVTCLQFNDLSSFTMTVLSTRVSKFPMAILSR
jgi:hypothetical protein